jgi:PTH1 family peptidyl-tRNA hydrolase
VSAIRLVLGLGNPGDEYKDSYHNVGFRVLDRIAAEQNTRFRERCGPALISGKVVLGGHTAILVAPQTYMNRSGAALPPVFERFEATAADLIVVYDDLALPLGKIRVRQKGSAGGHNGIKSLVSTLGSDEFLRIRVGILPDREVFDVREFVLSRVAKSDRLLIDQAEEVAAKAVEGLIAEGLEKAMAAYNGIDLREELEDK